MSAAFTRVVSALRMDQPFPGRRELERRRGRPYRARLGANECLFGPSPAALRALAAAAGELPFYNDPTVAPLREALAARWRRARGEIVVAEGIEGLLGLLVRAVVEPGDAAVTSLGGYPSLDYYVLGCGGRLIRPPYRSTPYANDLDALLDAARRHRAKLLYLANPDNPTGTVLAAGEVRRLAEALPEDCLLLLDEAYGEFAPQGSLLPEGEARPNLVRLRTFSKAYGLASARVGYAVADAALVAALDRIRQHFAVSQLSQLMAAAALEDGEFLDGVLARTAEGRAHYASLAERVGAVAVPGAANFVAFDFGSTERAKAMGAWLEERDVAVRCPADPPLDRLIRISVGPAELRSFLAQVMLEGHQRGRRSSPG